MSNFPVEYLVFQIQNSYKIVLFVLYIYILFYYCEVLYALNMRFFSCKENSAFKDLITIKDGTFFVKHICKDDATVWNKCRVECRLVWNIPFKNVQIVPQPLFLNFLCICA